MPADTGWSGAETAHKPPRHTPTLPTAGQPTSVRPPIAAHPDAASSAAETGAMPVPRRAAGSSPCAQNRGGVGRRYGEVRLRRLKRLCRSRLSTRVEIVLEHAASSTVRRGFGVLLDWRRIQQAAGRGNDGALNQGAQVGPVKPGTWQRGGISEPTSTAHADKHVDAHTHPWMRRP